MTASHLSLRMFQSLSDIHPNCIIFARCAAAPDIAFTYLYIPVMHEIGPLKL